MPRRRPNEGVPAPARLEFTAELRLALSRRKKAEWVEMLLDLARGDRGVLRHLMARIDLAATADELAAATRQAITDATYFDRRDAHTSLPMTTRPRAR